MKIDNGILKKIILFSTLMLIIVGGYMVLSSSIQRNRAVLREVEVNEKTLCDVDKVEITASGLNLSGWVFRTGAITKQVDVLLKAESSLESIFLKTEVNSEAKEISEHYELEEKFEAKSFIAVVNKKDIDENECYEIQLNFTFEIGNQTYMEKITTGKYMYDGILYSYNVKEFQLPEVKDESLQKIVNYGQLLVYDKKNTVWIYQHGKKLYWFIGNSFPFNNRKETYIFYHVRPIRENDLPSDRVQYGFDNMDFIFEYQEMILDNERYRVAVVELPEYNILTVKTGVYDTVSQRNINEYIFKIME